ncbi:MAG: hypothetical protein P4L86_02815 [Mycobacterium sp.]|nr:hypothetical protein [Mycobacterium sp.]
MVRRYGEELAGMFALAAAGLALVRAGIRLVDELDTETMPSPFFTTPG